jgi:osmotically-inducible protein OsmY
MQAHPNLATAATLAAALAASLTLAACHPVHEGRDTTAPQLVQAATALADSAMDGASDAAITVAVSTALATDTYLSLWHIAVHTVDGYVVLEGKAPDAVSRQRATRLAQGVPGVKSVDNRLSLPPMA